MEEWIEQTWEVSFPPLVLYRRQLQKSEIWIVERWLWWGRFHEDSWLTRPRVLTEDLWEGPIRWELGLESWIRLDLCSCRILGFPASLLWCCHACFYSIPARLTLGTVLPHPKWRLILPHSTYHKADVKGEIMQLSRSTWDLGPLKPEKSSRLTPKFYTKVEDLLHYKGHSLTKG